MKVSISPRARRNLVGLRRWWDGNRPGARVRVEDAFERVLEAIAAHPHLGLQYEARPKYRTWPVRGTPYRVFYFVDEVAGVIRIAAVRSVVREKGPKLE